MKNEQQLMKGPCSIIRTHSLSNKNHLHKANLDLISFQEKFKDWKMVYEREIQKTKTSLADMTPTLHGLGVAARIHKISDKAMRSLNTSPCRSVTPSSKIPSPRLDSSTKVNGCHSCDESSNQGDFLSSVSYTEDDYLNESFHSFGSQESEKAQKLMDVTKNIDNLTTIIERKILATHVSRVSKGDESRDDSIYSWNEEEPIIRTEIRDSNSLKDNNLEESVGVTNAALNSGIQSSPQNSDHLNEVQHLSRRRKTAHGLRSKEAPSRPVNLRDNLIILDKQRKLRDEGAELTSIEQNLVTPGRREEALMLLKKIFSPSPSTTSTSSSSLHSTEESAMQTPVNESHKVEVGSTDSVTTLITRECRESDHHVVSKVIAECHQTSLSESGTQKISSEHKSLSSGQAYVARDYLSKARCAPNAVEDGRELSINFGQNLGDCGERFSSEETCCVMKGGPLGTTGPEVVIRRSGIEITPSIFENLELGITIY